jgi:hypothetical protein
LSKIFFLVCSILNWAFFDFAKLRQFVSRKGAKIFKMFVLEMSVLNLSKIIIDHILSIFNLPKSTALLKIFAPLRETNWRYSPPKANDKIRVLPPTKMRVRDRHSQRIRCIGTGQFYSRQ